MALEKLSGHLLPAPTDWAALFGVERPLIVEIGFGQGDFLLDLARRCSDANVIGFEISNRCLTRVEGKIGRLKLSNVRVIHSMAETALHHLCSPASITQMHINFPDPWFKTSHQHRRLMQRDTLDAIISRLVPGGELYLATDIREYAEMTRDLLAASPGLNNLLPEAWVHDLPDRVITKYERIARSEGRACYYFAYRRNHLPAPDVPVIKDLPMPHVVFTSPLTLAQMIERFEPIQHSNADIHIHLMNAYLGKEAILVETHVGEPTITQHVALVMVARKYPETYSEHEYTIQLGTLGQPRPTEGVHRAVKLLAEWALRLHPENSLLKQKVSAE